MSLKRSAVSLLAATAMAVSLLPAAQTEIKADADSWNAATINTNMGIGWNLGNSLDAFGGSGLDTETSWSNPRTTQAMIDAVAAKGFKTVRVPTTWRTHTDSGYTIDSAWLARVKEVVDYCYNDGLYVILNVHHEEWNLNDVTNESVRLKTYWQQIAEYFKDYDYHLVFEGMNEPRLSDAWNGNLAGCNAINELNKVFAETVRASGGNNAKRAIMLPDYAASGVETSLMKNLDLDYIGDTNYIVSLHAYSPYDFTMGDKYASFDDTMEAQLQTVFDGMNSHFISKNIPVCIGEFSASYYNNNSARLKWAASYASKAKKYGMSCILWDNNAIYGSNAAENHGYLNRNTLSWYSESEGIADKLISTYNSTTTDTSAIKQPYDITTATSSTVLSTSSMTSTDEWVPEGSRLSKDLSFMNDNGYIVVKYSGTGACNMLLINGSWESTTIPADIERNGIAYFSCKSILSAWKTAFNSTDLSEIKVYGFHPHLKGASITTTNVTYYEFDSSGSTDPDPDDPDPVITDDVTESVISTAKVTLSQWQGSDRTDYDLSAIADNSAIKVEYSGSEPPVLVVQDALHHIDGSEYIGWKVWSQTSPYLIGDGVAYYLKDDIAESYANGYKSTWNEDLPSELYNVSGLLVQNLGTSPITVTKISYVSKAPYIPESRSATIADVVGFNSYADVYASDTPVMTAAVGENEPVSINGVPTENGSYKFTVPVCAPEMTEEIVSSISFTDKLTGKTITTAPDTCTVREYAMQVINHTTDSVFTDKAKAAARAMLNYGAYCQLNFDHNTDDLANSELSDKTPDFSGLNKELRNGTSQTVTTAEQQQAAFTKTSLVFRSGISLKFYAKLNEGISGGYLAYSSDDSSYSYIPLKENGNRYEAAIEGIEVTELEKAYDVYVADANKTQISSRLTYSPKNYANYWYWKDENGTLAKTCAAMINYCTAAKAYAQELKGGN